MPANSATKIIYDPENPNQPISIISGDNPGKSIQITDPDGIKEFIGISKGADGNPDLANIQNHLRNKFQLDVGNTFVTSTDASQDGMNQPGQMQPSQGGEEVDIGMGDATMGTQGTTDPTQDQDLANDELELAIDLNSMKRTDNIIKEIINMSKKDARIFNEKEHKHQKVVNAYKERLVSDDFITEMATFMEDDREAGTSLNHNKGLKKPESDGVEQDFPVKDGNSTDASEEAEYGDDIAARVDNDTITRPLDADNNYMNSGVDDYSVPVNDATEGDARATTAKTGTAAGEYADPKQKKTLDDSGWNLANYKKEGISKEEYDFLMEEISEEGDNL